MSERFCQTAYFASPVRPVKRSHPRLGAWVTRFRIHSQPAAKGVNTPYGAVDVIDSGGLPAPPLPPLTRGGVRPGLVPWADIAEIQLRERGFKWHTHPES